MWSVVEHGTKAMLCCSWSYHERIVSLTVEISIDGHQ